MSTQTVIIMGEVKYEPKYSHNGQKGVCTYTILTTDNYTSKSGESKEKQEYHNIVTFGKQAEQDSINIKKSDKVLVIGKLRTNGKDDKKTGRRVYYTNVYPDIVTYCGKAGEDEMEYVKTMTQESIDANIGW